MDEPNALYSTVWWNRAIAGGIAGLAPRLAMTDRVSRIEPPECLPLILRVFDFRLVNRGVTRIARSITCPLPGNQLSLDAHFVVTTQCVAQRDRTPHQQTVVEAGVLQTAIANLNCVEENLATPSHHYPVTGLIFS